MAGAFLMRMAEPPHEAVRTINRERASNTDDGDAVLGAQVPWVDHEISLFKQIYREPVSKAFAKACGDLDAQDRALRDPASPKEISTACCGS